MKRATIIAILAGLAILAVPASASAATVKHTGNLIGNPATPVKLTVVKKQGKATRIRGFTLRNVIMNCTDGQVRFSFLKAFGAIRVRGGTRFGVRLPERGGTGSMRLRGKVRKQGRKTRGTVKATLTGTEFDTCRLAKSRFRTRKA